MPSHYVDVEEFVANYEYTEEEPAVFDDNFINHLKQGEDN